LAPVDVIVWAGDPVTFQFDFVSEQAERITGYPVEAWLEPGFWTEHVHPSDRDWAIEFCTKATEACEPHAFEYRILAADGRIVWLRDVVSVDIEDGRPVRIRGVMVDVTERRLSEEARDVAETQRSAVLANAPVLLFAVDADGTFALCEGRALESAGLDPTTIVGTSYRGKSPQIQESIGLALAGERLSGTVTLRDRIFEIHYSAQRDEFGELQGVIGVGTDVTERVEALEERDRFEAQVRHVQKLESLGVLAGGIAHDFNNLLMSILGNADLALADILPEALGRTHVERIRDAGRRLSGLTQQLLAYSGKGTFVVQPLDVSRLIEQMGHLLAVGVSKKAMLRYELAPDLPAVEGDPSQLGQVIMNLVTNASDALGESVGSIVVRTGVMEVDRDYLAQAYVFEEYAEGPYVFVEVEDSGTGMDAETRGRIFDPFYTTKFSGQGLGLAVVLGVVRSHRGAVCVYSEPGQGTLFRVLIPCSSATVARTSKAPESAPDWTAAGTVLVVDDEAGVLEIAAEMLQRLGLEVHTAVDGLAGLEFLHARGDEIDLVLLDLTMPGLGGMEVLQQIERTRPDLPVVLMSGYNQSYSAQGSIDRIAGFLQKPFSREQLERVLRSALPKPD
jgi:PAS domain S-box-containing protein